MQTEQKKNKWLNHKTFGILISILFLFLIFHNINFSEVFDSMKSFNAIYAIPAIITYALSYLVRSLRWKELLSVSKDIKLGSVIKALYIGYMANTLLPARMGELYRAHILGTDQKITRSSALASIVAERVFDGLTLFLLMVILVSFFYNNPLLTKICFTTGCIFLGSFTVIAFVSIRDNSKCNVIKNITSKLPEFIRDKIQVILTSFIDGLGVISSFKGFLFIILTSGVAWLLEWATMFIIVSGFSLSTPIKPIAIAFLVVLVAFSTMIPSGPAFVGPYQYAFIIALDLTAITKDTALAIAVTTQFIMMAPVVIVGMILLWRSHLSLKEIPETAHNNSV